MKHHEERQKSEATLVELPVQQRWNNYRVAQAAHREQLSNALNEGEDERLEYGHRSFLAVQTLVLPDNYVIRKALWRLTQHIVLGYCLLMTSMITAKRPPRHGLAAISASSIVLAIAVGFYAYAAAIDTKSSSRLYELRASFLSSNGLRSGADVVLAGVPIGAVKAIDLEPQTATAQVRFVVPVTLRLPVDTKLAIGSSTLTSANALMVIPGKSQQMLTPDSVITDTCELISLEQQVSQYIFGSGGAPSDCGK